MLKQVHDGLEKHVNSALRGDGLTLMQVAFLVEVSEAEGGRMTMKQLERRFRIAQPTASGIVARLEGKGLLAAEGDASDARVKVVRATRAGLSRCEDARRCMGEAEEMLLAGFSADERAAFQSLLVRTAANVG